MTKEETKAVANELRDLAVSALAIHARLRIIAMKLEPDINTGYPEASDSSHHSG